MPVKKIGSPVVCVSEQMLLSRVHGSPPQTTTLTSVQLLKDTIEQSHLAPSVVCALRYGMASVLLLPFLFKPGIKKLNVNLSFELGLMLFAAYQCQARELVTETASEGVQYGGLVHGVLPCSSPSCAVTHHIRYSEIEIKRNSYLFGCRFNHAGSFPPSGAFSGAAVWQVLHGEKSCVTCGCSWGRCSFSYRCAPPSHIISCDQVRSLKRKAVGVHH